MINKGQVHLEQEVKIKLRFSVSLGCLLIWVDCLRNNHLLLVVSTILLYGYLLISNKV